MFQKLEWASSWKMGPWLDFQSLLHFNTTCVVVASRILPFKALPWRCFQGTTLPPCSHIILHILQGQVLVLPTPWAPSGPWAATSPLTGVFLSLISPSLWLSDFGGWCTYPPLFHASLKSLWDLGQSTDIWASSSEVTPSFTGYSQTWRSINSALGFPVCERR